MTQLVKFPIDQAYKVKLRDFGFDLDDPDRRYPTRNDFPQKILGQRPMSLDGKAALLLGDRGGRSGTTRTRVLPWLLAGCAGQSFPESAFAHDHHPTDHTETAPSAPEGIAWPDVSGLLDTVSLIDWANPVWGLSLGAALLLTQTIGVIQRRALLQTCSASLMQPDLFPDTLENAEAEEIADVAPAPRSWRWQVDAQTRQGQVRSENQDALATLRFADDRVALIVCDGAGGVGGGRDASQSAVKAIEAHLLEANAAKPALEPSDLEAAIAAARQASEEQELEGVTIALIAVLEEDMLHFATLGDGAVSVIWPDGMIGQVQIPHHTLEQPSNVIDAYIGGGCEVAPRIGSLRLEQGCLVMAMSDGVGDLITFEDFASRRAQFGNIEGLVDAVLAQLEEARDPDTGGWLHSDNMTLAMARLERTQ